jgi:predicted nucleic acid-binding protein
MYQVVLDTNVLVAALRSKLGASHLLRVFVLAPRMGNDGKHRSRAI